MEIIPTHEHFAADLHEIGDVLLGAAELCGDGADGAHVQCDVLAGDAVAARQALFEHAIAVDEVQRQTVDLDFAAHGQRLMLRPVEVANHRIIPILELFDGEDIIEAHHAARVAHGREIVGERAADPMGGRLGVVQ